MTTNTELHYKAYHAASNKLLEAKKQLKELKSNRENTNAAKEAARKVTDDRAERIAIVLRMMQPLDEAIIETEQAIIRLQSEADEEWNAYRGLK